MLSSYTHSALDNILKRFIDTYPMYKSTIVRIASNENSVDEKIHEFMFYKKKFKSVNDIKEYFKTK